jgi:hypothetical protein
MRLRGVREMIQGFVSSSEQAFNASQCSWLNTFLHAILSRVMSR